MATSKLTALAPKVASLGENIDTIGELADTQTMPTTGATADRLTTLGAVQRATFAVAGPLLSYARSQGMAQLESVVDLRRSDFKNLRQEERTRLAQRIHDAAQPLLVAAGPYGLTTEMLEDLAAKIDAADGAVAAPRAVKADKRMATQNLAKAFAEAETLLAQIDPMMTPFRDSDPELFGRYQLARQVIDRPGTRHADETPAANAAAPVAPAAVAASPSANSLPKAA